MDVEIGATRKKAKLPTGPSSWYRDGRFWMSCRQHLGRNHQPQSAGDAEREICQPEKPNRKSTPHVEAHTVSAFAPEHNMVTAV
jgi:hypothetical protein